MKEDAIAMELFLMIGSMSMNKKGKESRCDGRIMDV